MPSSIGVIFSLNVTNIFAVAEKKRKERKRNNFHFVEVVNIFLKWRSNLWAEAFLFLFLCKIVLQLWCSNKSG